MSRFSGKQYPGAMKDHRAKLRAEAEGRRAKLDEPASVLDALAAIGAAIFAPFLALADGFVAAAEAFRGVKDQTQDDFALVHGELRCGGAEERAPRQLSDGRTPFHVKMPLSSVPEYVLTPEEWAEVHRLAKERGEEQ